MIKQMIVKKTNERVPFLDLKLGSIFYKAGRFWIKTGMEVATDISGQAKGDGYGSCNFNKDVEDRIVTVVEFELK